MWFFCELFCPRFLVKYWFEEQCSCYCCWCDCEVHAAIIAINDAVDHCVATTTLSCLLNPAAHMSNIIHELSENYQSTLFDAKQVKKEIAFNKVRDICCYVDEVCWNNYSLVI